MKAWVFVFLVACGTSQAPSEETPAEETPPEDETSQQETSPGESSSETPLDDETSQQETNPEALLIIEGPRNFVTPHHCHPPGPCRFEFEALRGVQHIDVGHGHLAAPRLDVLLRVSEGSARVEALQATPVNEARGTIVARSRDSLEGGAFYVTLDGDASSVEMELSFRFE